MLPIGSRRRRLLYQSTHSRVANSTASILRHGPRRRITSVLNKPLIVSAVDGRVISRRVGRAKLLGLVESLAPKVVAMEACATAHHWARAFLGIGCEVRLINPRFVKPFVRGSKNDAVDAEAIFDAASRPTMRFVPVKSTEQQDLQSLHRVRDRLVAQRT